MSDFKLLMFITALVVFFIGEPDLHDALISYLYGANR